MHFKSCDHGEGSGGRGGGGGSRSDKAANNYVLRFIIPSQGKVFMDLTCTS